MYTYAARIKHRSITSLSCEQLENRLPITFDGAVITDIFFLEIRDFSREISDGGA